MLVEYLKKIGYNDAQINKIKSSYIYQDINEESAISRIESVWSYFDILGLSKDEIISITADAPNLLTFTPTKLAEKINNFILLGFKETEALAILKKKFQSLYFRNW